MENTVFFQYLPIFFFMKSSFLNIFSFDFQCIFCFIFAYIFVAYTCICYTFVNSSGAAASLIFHSLRIAEKKQEYCSYIEYDRIRQ